MNEGDLKDFLIESIKKGELMDLSTESSANKFECYDSIELKIKLPLGWIKEYQELN